MKTQEDSYGMYKVKTRLERGPEIMGADTLLGTPVYNLQDESLGEIKEIMLNMHTARVAYVVLSDGGFMGKGERLFAVPWDALTLNTGKKRFTLDMKADQLAHAPGFDSTHWPNMADQIWASGVHTYYNTKLYLDNIRM